MGLMNYVKTLALNPPVEAWRAKAPDGVIENNIQAIGYINTWEQAGSICDLVSYIVMRIALGADRMSRLEQISGDGDLLDSNGSVRRFTDATEFSIFMSEWIAKDTPGVVQFKFAAKNDVHTFAAERIILAGRKTFQVYQGYQGGYRLSDFLGITEVRAFLLPRILLGETEKYNRMLWRDDPSQSKTENDFVYQSECLEKGVAKENIKVVRKRWALTQDAVTKSLNEQVSAVKQTSNELREPMGEDIFREKVISLLSAMLGSGTTAYQDLSGHKARGSVTCKKLLVVTGDYVDSQLEVNFKSLLQREGISRGFITID